MTFNCTVDVDIFHVDSLYDTRISGILKMHDLLR